VKVEEYAQNFLVEEVESEEMDVSGDEKEG
jgi:hypothetical protein